MPLTFVAGAGYYWLTAKVTMPVKQCLYFAFSDVLLYYFIIVAVILNNSQYDTSKPSRTDMHYFATFICDILAAFRTGGLLTMRLHCLADEDVARLK